MNKDEKKMIEELAKILKNHCDNISFDDCMGSECEECRARTVINADYRKVADDEIVESMKTYERARQETARAILQELKEIHTVDCGYTDWIDDTYFGDEYKRLCNKYDIELED